MALEIFNSDDLQSKKGSGVKTNSKSDRKKPEFPAGVFVVTDIKQAVKNPNRANVYINGKYRFSLDVYQLTELKVKMGTTFNEDELQNLEQQSEFGKLYARTLEYCLMRPHSEKEVRDYLWKKTMSRRLKNKKTGEIYDKQGVSKISVDQVLKRLKDKDYINDERFSRWWVENRNQRKGTSLKKLRLELQQKGVSSDIITLVLEESCRSDEEEITKIIAKKGSRYTDQNKLIAYLVRQGFSYDDIKRALNHETD